MSPAGLWDQGAISNQNLQLLVPTATGNGLAWGHSRAAAPRDVSLLGLLPPGTLVPQSLPSGCCLLWLQRGPRCRAPLLGCPRGTAQQAEQLLLLARKEEQSLSRKAGWDQPMIQA